MDLYQKQLQDMIKLPLPWERLEGKTVLLSGATGMIGKCLTDVCMLRNQTAVQPVKLIALSRDEQSARKRLREYFTDRNFMYYACDVNQLLPDMGAVDVIIHAASNTHPLQYSQDAIGTITSNVIGTKNLLDYAVSHGAERFCFVSSVEIYGENRGDVEKFSEEYLGYIDCNTLRAGYPESKRLGETLCNAYQQSYGLDFVIPRLSRIYGPTMLLSDSKALSQFVKKAAAAEDIILKSEGNQQYSYTFVTDAVSAILYALLCGESGMAYNVADEASDITLKELAEFLAGAAGTRVVFELPDERERRGYSTATRAMLAADRLKALGWRAAVGMKDGLRCTVEAVRRRKF